MNIKILKKNRNIFLITINVRATIVRYCKAVQSEKFFAVFHVGIVLFLGVVGHRKHFA